MPDLILHHYEMSPYSEKIRRILAYKELPWSEVRAPAIMPKPDLVALTGGYRRVPVLQIGNHVYCDTALIARVLEALAPEPTLYPTPLAQALAEWFDGAVFEAVMPFVARPTRFDEVLRMLTPEEAQGIGADRKEMVKAGRRRPMGYKNARAALSIYLVRLDRAAMSSPFLLGDEPSIADFAAHHGAWLLDKIAPEPLAPHAYLREWMERVEAIEGEAPSTLTSDAALEICRESEEWEPDDAFDASQGFEEGDVVTITANDYGCDAVQGTLVQSTLSEVAIRREDPRAGVVYVHFPRIGYDLARAES